MLGTGTRFTLVDPEEVGEVVDVASLAGDHESGRDEWQIARVARVRSKVGELGVLAESMAARARLPSRGSGRQGCPARASDAGGRAKPSDVELTFESGLVKVGAVDVPPVEPADHERFVAEGDDCTDPVGGDRADFVRTFPLTRPSGSTSRGRGWTGWSTSRSAPQCRAGVVAGNRARSAAAIEECPVGVGVRCGTRGLRCRAGAVQPVSEEPVELARLLLRPRRARRVATRSRIAAARGSRSLRTAMRSPAPTGCPAVSGPAAVPGHEDGVEPAVARARAENGVTLRRLDLPVEARSGSAMKRSRSGSGPGSGRVEQRDDEARVLPADAARCLDVLGGRLRLAHHHHQPEPVDVDADRDHVRREDDVEGIAVGVGRRPFVCRWSGISPDGSRLVSSIVCSIGRAFGPLRRWRSA